MMGSRQRCSEAVIQRSGCPIESSFQGFPLFEDKLQGSRGQNGLSRDTVLGDGFSE